MFFQHGQSPYSFVSRPDINFTHLVGPEQCQPNRMTGILEHICSERNKVVQSILEKAGSNERLRNQGSDPFTVQEASIEGNLIQVVISRVREI